MSTETTGGASTGAAPADGMTNAEKLTALQTYLKALKPMEEHLRGAALADMQAARAERVGAFLPNGEKIGTVGLVKGRKSAKVTDDAAALRWCLAKYPEAVVQAINPAFLKKIVDYSAAVGGVGEPGVDPETGELLDFIEVREGSPYVTVSTTKEGVARMTELAHGFAGMLEQPSPAEVQLDATLRAAHDAQIADLNATTDPAAKLDELFDIAGVRPGRWEHNPGGSSYDEDFADRLSNGAYER